eukprot:1034034-Rhodomonas_salina.1
MNPRYLSSQPVFPAADSRLFPIAAVQTCCAGLGLAPQHSRIRQFGARAEDDRLADFRILVDVMLCRGREPGAGRDVAGAAASGGSGGHPAGVDAAPDPARERRREPASRRRCSPPRRAPEVFGIAESRSRMSLCAMPTSADSDIMMAPGLCCDQGKLDLSVFRRAVSRLPLASTGAQGSAANAKMEATMHAKMSLEAFRDEKMSDQ